MPVADAPKRGAARRKSPARKPRPKKPTTARGPQGLPIQHASPQRRSTPRPVPRAPEHPVSRNRGPQGLAGPSKPVITKATRTARRRENRAGQKLARQHFFPKDAAGALRRSEQNAVQALSEFKASNPKKYHDLIQRHHDRHAGPLNVSAAARDVGKVSAGANKLLLKGAGAVEKGLTVSSGEDRAGGPHLTTHMAGFAPSHAAKEALDLVANAPTSAYLSGKAVVGAAHGDTRELKKQWREYKKTSALTAAASGHFGQALKRAGEHPISSYLELSGAKAVVGRTGGAIARHAPSETLRKAGSTDRPNLRLYPHAKPGEGPEVGRRYSKDIITKGRQVAQERAAMRRRQDPHVARGPYHEAPLQPQSVVGLDRRSAVSHLRRRVDTRVFSQDRVAQHRKANAEHDARAILKKKPAAAVHLVAEGTVRVDRIRADLRKRRLALAKSRQHLSDPERLRLNRDEAKHIRELEALPDAKLLDAVHAARDFGKQQAPVQARGLKAGTWDATGRSKRHYPALQSHVRRPEATELRPLTPEERVVVAKSLTKRVRKGKAVPPRAAAEAKRHMDARLKAHAREHRTATAAPESAWFAPKPLARVNKSMEARGITNENRHGRGYLDENGVLNTWNEKMGTHAEIARGRGVDVNRTQDIMIRPDGTVIPHVSRGMTDEEVVAKAVAQDRRLKPTEEMAASPQFQDALARAEAEFRAPLPDKPSMRPGVGKPALLRRSDFKEYVGGKRIAGRQVGGVRRAERVPVRPLTDEELATSARVLERRSRRGQAGLSGQVEGGPVLVTQRPGRARLGTRLRPSAPFEPTRARKGTAFTEGSREVGKNAVVRQAVGAEAEVTAAEGFQLLDREFGTAAGENGRRYAQTYNEAEKRAKQLTLDENGYVRPDRLELVPVNIAQFQTFGARLRAKQEQGMPRNYAKANDVEGKVASDTWDAALAESGRGKWVLMPREVVERLRDHASVQNWGALHSTTSLFKDVVLTSSSPARWMGGNAGDLGMRTAFEGLTPADIARGRIVVHRAAKQGLQGEHAAMATAGGGFFHAASALNRAFRPHGYEEHIARTALSAPWRLWKGSVYYLESKLEELPQYGRIGKAMREEFPMHGKQWAIEDGKQARDLKSLLRLHDKQIDHFVNRLANDRAFEAQIQGLTEDVIGRWGKISPKLRRALVLAPFAQWLGAAMRYVLITLPTKHPIKTGILAGSSQMTDKERKALGLSYLLPRDQQVSDYQMGSIPTKIGHNKYGPVVEGIRTARMTSLGTAAGFPGNIGDFLVPQFASALNAWAGQAFTGETLTYPDWWPDESKRRLPIPPDERYKIGLGALMESSVPFASMFRRAVIEKGRPSEPTSTILTPATRKHFDKKTKTFTDEKANVGAGLQEWASPVAPAGRLYTYGTGKAIEEQGIAGEQLDKWRKLPKKRSKNDPYGFDGGVADPKADDPSGFGKRGLSKKSNPNPYGF